MEHVSVYYNSDGSFQMDRVINGNHRICVDGATCARTRREDRKLLG